MSLVVSVQGRYRDLPLPEKLGLSRTRAANLNDIKVTDNEGSEPYSLPSKKNNRYTKQIEKFKKQEQSFKKDHSHLPRVHEVMTSPVITLTPRNTIQEAWDLMQKKMIRHIPLLENDIITGLVTQSDILKHLNSPSTRLAIIGLKDIILAKGSADLRLASSVMIERRIGCLPVIDDDKKLCGILTYVDILEYFVGLDPFGTWG